jgi:hypothetical protein
MELKTIIDNSIAVGGCETYISGVSKVFLVDVGSGFSLLYAPETIESISNEMNSNAYKMEINFQSGVFTSKAKTSENGIVFENSLSFRLSNNVSEWLFSNKEKGFWLIFKKGEQWFISGDDMLPYYINMDYSSGKSAGEENGQGVELVSTQMKPYHIYKRFIILSTADWTLMGELSGEGFLESSSYGAGEFVVYSGFVWQAITTVSPSVWDADEWSLVGQYSGVWENVTYPIGNVVKLGGSIYYHETSNNGFTYNI